MSSEAFDHINAIRGFRHVFRHAYGYTLKWHLMKSNVLRLPAAHHAFTGDISSFLSYLQQLAEEA